MKIVIVGAGPAGLFAALELADWGKVTVIDKEKYIGGSGLHSDGKLNFHPSIGGNLTEFLSLSDAWNLINHLDKIFEKHGVEQCSSLKGLEELEDKAAKARIKFIPIRQKHIGSDKLPKLMNKLKAQLENKGVEFKLNTEVLDLEMKKGFVKRIKTDKGIKNCDYVLLAPGRSGCRWLKKLADKFNITTKYNPIDIGVRVEVSNKLMKKIIYEYGCWDPKFWIKTQSYDDFVRTFCVSPSGFVVTEAYENSLFGVNGHSFWGKKSNNTNFAFLVRVSLTEPLENTTEYGRAIAQKTNILGGGKPILQRLGDLKKHRRSTWDRINRGKVKPTLKHVTPGDIAMAYPYRTVRNILEGLEKLNKVIPGIDSNSTLLYAPEIKFYAMRIKTNKNLQTSIPNLFVAGDGAGVSRGIIGAAATGIIAARRIKNLI